MCKYFSGHAGLNQCGGYNVFESFIQMNNEFTKFRKQQKQYTQKIREKD